MKFFRWLTESLGWLVRTWKVRAAVVLALPVVVSSVRCICLILALSQLTFRFPPRKEGSQGVCVCVRGRERVGERMQLSRLNVWCVCVSVWQRQREWCKRPPWVSQRTRQLGNTPHATVDAHRDFKQRAGVVVCLNTFLMQELLNHKDFFESFLIFQNKH